MMWLDKQVSLYLTHADNFGRPASYRDILLSDFARDISTINRLQDLQSDDPEYKQKKLKLKSTLQCFTPAALFESKMKNNVRLTHQTGVMQLDFDYNDICDYDVEELKRAVFALPFIGFCGLSCSGNGFYALGLIAEPEKLSEYAEHCFGVLLKYGIKADTSKGKKVENLRYVSYDSNMLIRTDPTPLHVKQFKKKAVAQVTTTSTEHNPEIELSNERIASGFNRLRRAMIGGRWETVQKVAYTLGGLGIHGLLREIEIVIDNTNAFSGEEEKYKKCAAVCFAEGAKNLYQQ